MTRRALIFTVPKGKEIHYSKIQGPIIGSVWAPLYHSYSYYMPANTSRDPDGENTTLKLNSKLGLGSALLTVLTCASSCSRRCFVGGIRVRICHVGRARHVRFLPCKCTRGWVFPLVRNSRTFKRKVSDKSTFGVGCSERFFTPRDFSGS